MDRVGMIVEKTRGALWQQKLYSQEQMERTVRDGGLVIHGVYEENFECKSSIRCYGEFTSEFGVLTITYASRYSDWEAVLAHEFVHFFNYTIDGNDDPMHKDERFFEFGCRWKYPETSQAFQDCQRNSVEGIVKSRL
jgi:hypothetical protein